ncbi:DNA primase [Candidatus Endowatersipora endosymbiont of Watersipora subatra]|uniref:DNA primase n=1 Tax=Candidatus Endowatersipora endosymbiont of Watersipora subatra TaxID=3077946 RepID=UPI00312CB5D9
MHFSPSFLEDLRDRIPISNIVGRRITFDLKKSNPSKGDFWACCPFHGEETASFHCQNTKGRYYCFGCGVSGDHFRFMMELDGLSFPESVKRLSEEVGISVHYIDSGISMSEEKKYSLYDLMMLAALFFQDQLQTENGAKARLYLQNRGIPISVQREFGLGYAPSSYNALKKFLSEKKIEESKIEACGLVVFGPDIATSYDRFRDRIMFPILDEKERVIAFGGRSLSSGGFAKYLNSPETELFSKSKVLYNYSKARKAIQRNGNLIIAEGYMDVITLSSAGFFNAVAPLGTTLTQRQLELAWRVGAEPILCFDGDEAGMQAHYRSIETAFSVLKPGKSIWFVLLPNHEDPDDIIRHSGGRAFGKILQSPFSLSDMLWIRETKGRKFDTPERRAHLELKIKTVIRKIFDETVRRYYEKEMDDRLRYFFGVIKEKSKRCFNDSQRGNPLKPVFAKSPNQFSVSERLMNSALVNRDSHLLPLRESTLMVTVINHPLVALSHFEEFSFLDSENPRFKRIQSALLDFFAAEGEGEKSVSSKSLRNFLDSREFSLDLDQLERQVESSRVWQALPCAAFEDAREGWIQAYALHMRARYLNNELRLMEKNFAELGDEASYERLVGLQLEIENVDRMEGLIEGFGVSSGRPVRVF